MDSPTMTETEEKIKASAEPSTPQTEQKTSEKEVKKEAKKEEKKEEAEEEEDFQEEIIESSGAFYDEAEDVPDQPSTEPVVEDSIEEPEPQFANEAYIKSFENRTIDEILREEKENQKEKAQEPEKEPEKFDNRSLKEYFADLRRARNQEQEKSEIQVEEAKEIEPVQEPSSVIEKPNYDLLETEKKVIKITQKKKKKERKKAKKAASIALAVALAFTGGICIVNSVLIDQQYSAYVEIGDTYELNLQKYLKNISNLDATKKSMEVIETYPEEVNDAGDLGEVSNWFDRICNFLSGLFGG